MSGAVPHWTDGEPVDPSAYVTQVGDVDSKVKGKNGRAEFRFQALLREDQDETEMSCYFGRMSIAEAVERISLGARPVIPMDAVRYASVNALLKNGFQVVHSPDIIVEHVSVTIDREWNGDVARLFEACFSEYVRG